MRLTLALLVILVVVLAACGVRDEARLPGAGEPVDQLDGEWLLVEGTGPGGPVPLLRSHPITLSIDGADWGGTACNHYGGTVEADNGRLRVGDLIQTDMACDPPEVMDSEAAYLDALRQVDGYEVADDRLTLTGHDVRLVYEPVMPEPEAALVGTEWHLDTLLLGSGPDSAATQATEPAPLRLHDSGRLTAGTGCRELEADYEVDGDRLLLSDVLIEDRECPEAQAFMDEIVVDVLSSQVALELDGSGLTLTGADGRALVYRARR